MTKPYGDRFSDALVSEIKAEMGRLDLSSRALGRLIGKSSQYMSDRLDGGSAKTGRRVVLSVRDLAAIAQALGMRPSDITSRAHYLALGGDPNALPLVTNEREQSGLGGELIEGRFTRDETDEREVAASSFKPPHPDETPGDFDA